MLVKDCMCRDLIVLDINTSIQEIGKIMKEYDIGFVPIHKSNKIIGVLTDRDIVTRIISNNDDKIEGYISRDLIRIDENENLNEALDLMAKNRTKRLLVTNENKVTGILSLSDLLGYDSDKVIECIKDIYTIHRNNDKYITRVDEFEL